MKPTSGKVKHSGHLATALSDLDVLLSYDVRGHRIIDQEGRMLSEMEFDLLVDRAVRAGWDIPTRRTDHGKRIWNAYLYERGFDPLVVWLDEVADSIPPEQGINPMHLPWLLWPERVRRDEAKLVGWSWLAFFRAVIARAMMPPVRFDVVPIIQGPQGCGKSTAITNLLPFEWTNGGFPLQGVKDFDSSRKVAEFTEGKAILESSEMVGMKAGNREAVKSFLTQHTDRSTRKYAIQAEDVPRRWCIAGTTNDPFPIPYDPSGGRRWIVTEVEGLPPESDPTDGPRIAHWMAEHRERLWSYAVHRFRALRPTDVERTLSVPKELAEAHAGHVARLMWTPPGQCKLGGF